MSHSLQDQPARDRFKTELGRNFCVSAGAGAGKTTSIVERIAAIAQTRPETLSRLVVVTYGKGAAEELRSRSRLAVLKGLKDRQCERRKLLGEFRRAFFGTIHSFCLMLVQEQGRRLGLAPGLELLQEPEDGDLWARFADQLDFAGLDLPAGCLDAAMRFVSIDDLFATARKIAPGDAERLREDLKILPCPTLTFERALSDPGKRAPETTAAHQETLRDWLMNFHSGNGFLKLPEFKTGAKGFKESFSEESAPFIRWMGNLVGRITASIALAFRDFRLGEGYMTYDDQILWCRKLIEEPRTLDRLRARRYSVILDEAQDTDSMMFSILAEITRAPGALIDAWPGSNSAPGPEPGRFCFVGDDQQAIYASRADISVYREYVEAYRREQGGENLEFSVTMRCPDRVIDAVNGIFSANGRLDQAHVRFRKLLPKPAAGEGAVWLLPIRFEETEAGIDELFLAECRQVAAFLAGKGPQGLGVTGWGEVAVLCPRHKWLAAAARTLRASGLPCRLIDSKQLDLELAHRTWPVALLHVVLNPWDRFELIGVLREIFALSDVELATAHRAAGNGLTLQSAASVSPRLEQALAVLRRIRAALPSEESGTLSRFVDFALDQASLAARLEAIGCPAGSLDAFRFEALDAECRGAFLREWIAARVGMLGRDAEEVRESGDEIQLLTCMKSKGLEWPVVVPLGLGREIGRRNEGFPAVRARGKQIEFHFTGVTVDPDSEVEEKAREREEFQRVFYVTLTRSKSLLVLPDSSRFYPSKPGGFNFFELSKWSELPAEGTLFQEPTSMPAPPIVGKIREAKSYRPPSAASLKKAAGCSKQVPRRILPHELAGHATHHPPEQIAMISDTGGLNYGLWWHQTVQHFPWQAPAARRDSYLETAIGEASVIPGLGARAARELQSWSRSPLVAELIGQGRVILPETPFSHPRSAEEWLEGIIDLVVVTHTDVIWVVDWKTDRRLLGEEEGAFRERLRRTYFPQLEAYGEVLAKGMGRKVERLVLYSTEAACAVE